MKRIILAAAFITSCLAFWIWVSEGMGNNVIFSGGIAVCLWCYGGWYAHAVKIKWLNALLRTGAVCAIGLVLFLAIYGQMDTVDYQENVAIVLGAGLRGEKVSATLQRRLDTAVTYHRKNPDAWLIVTGGQGPKEVISEALAMKRYLVACGIPAEQIIMEEQAASTYENMLYTKTLLDTQFPGGCNTVIITSDFHMYRSARFAAQFGIICTRLHAETLWYTLAGNYIRESAAVIKLWLIKR